MKTLRILIPVAIVAMLGYAFQNPVQDEWVVPEEYINMIRKEVDRHALKYCSDGLVIKTAKLKDQAGFIGAAHYALERLDGKIP